MTIYTSYQKPHPDQELTKIALGDVLSGIQKGEYAELTLNYQNENSPMERAKHKKALPSFSPCVELFTSSEYYDDNRPTGIIHFDIDILENRSLNTLVAKRHIASLPEVAYCFISPSKGLKFAIMSDFSRDSKEPSSQLKQRYKRAYKEAKRYIMSQSKLNIDTQFDDTANDLEHFCYVSNDEDAYINLECETFEINEKIKEGLAYELSYDYDANEDINQFLECVPDDFEWEDRRPINFEVFKRYGEDSIDVLAHHWNATDSGDIREELNLQYQVVAQNIEETDINWMRTHPNYNPNIKGVTESDHQFEKLYSPDQATNELKKLVDRFFKDRKSTFINISAGHGKTAAVLDALKEAPADAQILYLTPNHKLAKEVVTSFTADKNEELTDKIVHLEGKSRACSAKKYNEELDQFERNNGISPPSLKIPAPIEAYEGSNIPAPFNACKSCDFFKQRKCDYFNQFDSQKPIRVMTHEQLTNYQSSGFYGINVTKNADGNEEFKPKQDNRKPDFIIVDENWLKENNISASFDSNFNSICLILSSLKLGLTMTDAIKTHSEQVFVDIEAAKLLNLPEYSTDAKFAKKYIQAHAQQADIPILKTFYEFLLTGNKTEIRKLSLEKFEIKYCRIRQIAKRYEGVPTLFLDATADKRVIKAVIGDIPFESIKVKPSDQVNVYQAEDLNITKSWFIKRKDDIPTLIETLRGYNEKYQNVGLITYKTINDTDKKPIKDLDEWFDGSEPSDSAIGELDKWLARRTGISTFGHFGDLRGSNQFKGVDCLIVLGRHSLRLDELPDYTHAIFGTPPPQRHKQYHYSMKADTPVLMKDGTSKSIINFHHYDANMRSVHKQFCVSETIQAIGRGRIIHCETKKDIFLFSKESLGSDIQVTSFFKKEDVLPKDRFTDQIKSLKETGYCKISHAELRKLGMTDEYSKKVNRPIVTAEFEKAGIEELISIQVKNKWSNKSARDYYTSDRTKLKTHIESLGLTILDSRFDECR